MADSSGAGSSCTVCLPLILKAEEDIRKDGVEEIAKDIKQHLHLFQRHIRSWKDFSYVRVKDVTFESGFVYLTFEFNSEESLNSFYACTKDERNELSKCLGQYFYEQGIEFIAGLRLGATLSCEVKMTRRHFLQAKQDMAKKEPTTHKSKQDGGERKDKRINVHYEIVTENTELPQGTNRAKHEESGNTDRQKQPGSYPQDDGKKDNIARSSGTEQTRSDKSATQTPIAKKQFILHYPLSKGWKIDDIYIESEKFKILNKALACHIGNLYSTTIDIPLKLLERHSFMTFRYVVVLKYTGFIGKAFYSDLKETSKIFFLDDSNCHRHLWEQTNIKVPQKNIVFGFIEHLEDIIFHCSSNQETKSTCIEIETYCSKKHFSREEAFEILTILTGKLLEPGYRPNDCLMFLVIVKCLLRSFDAILKNKLVNAETAMKLLQALQSSRLNYVPSSSQRDIQSVYYQFCVIALGSNMCCLKYLWIAYPFYDEEFVLKRIESNTIICQNSETMLPFANELCSKLYRKALSVTDNSPAKSILEKLVRNLPLNVSMGVFANLYRDEEALSSNESNVQSTIYGSISVRVEKMLVDSKKSNNLSSLLAGWKSIQRFKSLSVKFKNKYEHAIIHILESQSNYSESVQEIIDSFIYQFGFFKEKPKQKELIDVVVKSKNAEISKLFISLANSTVMCELFMQLESSQFRQYCMAFISGPSQYMGREFTFRYVCEHLNSISHMQQMERRADFRDIWENMLLEELQTYRFREVLQKLKLLDTLSRDNEHFGIVFLKYVRANLLSNMEAFRPEELFRWLDGYSESPQVNDRISALIINVMIDVYGCFPPELSIFQQFQQLLDHGTFWRTLHFCGGAYVDYIRENNNFIHVQNCIKQMVELFKNHEVSYDFVVDIESNSQLCRTTKSLLQLKCKQAEIEKYWSEAYLKFKEEKDKLRKSLNVIKIICNQLKKGDIHECFLNIFEHLGKVDAQLTGGKVTAKECIQNNLIWSNVESLPSLCEFLEQIVSSSVFWNICLEDVKEEYREKINPIADDTDPLRSICLLFQDFSVQDKYETNSTNAIDFLNILAKTGVQSYKEGWTRLLSEESFKMNDVLIMFGKKPNVVDEVNIARKTLLCNISEDIVRTLERVYAVDKIKSAVHSVTAVLRAFKIDSDSSFSLAIESFNHLRKGAATDYTFSAVKDALEIIFSATKDLSDNTISIMNELGKSTTLIGFLQEIVDEDIRNLIDAVEDISEQQVRESTVSALIEVKRYIQPILIPSSERTCRELVNILESQTRSRGNSQNLPVKIADCMGHLHNLKSLYNNVANRGEQTKEMIKNINHRGTFIFQLNKESDFVDFEVNYKQNKTKEVRQRSTLTDLRSRALLLMNTERKEVGGSHVQSEELSDFVNYINLCLDIADCLFELYSTGHTEDMRMRTLVRPAELEEKKIAYNDILKTWLYDLQVERKKHYLMNFVHGTQIQVLYRYLEGNEKDVSAIHTLLKFIHPAMRVGSLREFYQTEKASFVEDENKMLHCIGATLTKAFNGLALYERPITVDMCSKKFTDRVQASKLLVAQLEDGSVNTVKTVIGLYLNTTQRLPEPNQVLFCTRSTTKDELDLLIRRCLGGESFYKVTQLFCIANVELLSNEIQFGLVDTLRHIGKDQKYFLALVCRGSRNHPFIDELNDFVTSVTPATDKTVRQIFREHCACVSTITSDKAGQGKTSFIHSFAHTDEKSVATLHISGPMRKSTLVEKLQSMNVKEFHLLHIDIGSVDDATELDTFIFELVVLRFVSAAKVSFSLRTHDIQIEIANTIHDTLRNALQTAMLFTRNHVEWKGIRSFVVSKEIDSPTQVVCKYLDSLEKNIIDNVDLMVLKADFSPLSKTYCRRLLDKYLDDSLFTSYPIIHTFLSVLADQLKKLSQSSFFRVSRLRDMVGSKTPLTVKSKLVRAMIQMSLEFATRSVTECREAQCSTVRTGYDVEDSEMEPVTLASESVDRVSGMIRWEESNHQVFVFHNQNIQTLSALYRRLDKVEEAVKILFESQMKKKMDDFSIMNQEALQSILQKVSRTNPLPLPSKKLISLANDYALTADNLLKMVLIMLRIRANVPVIIMGETGCGKTSLIRYLAQICEVEFDVMNIHAGVSADEILRRVHGVNELALKDLKSERWLFLDEINTSESIGMMSDIICHHACLGKELSPNLIILGACNPYKLRTSKAISTAGLDSKVVTDELSRLVYRVLPLPDMLVDYVWDFGSLSEEDENKYIFRMTDDVFPSDSDLHSVLTSLLSASQAFVRDKESSAYSVSLRDVQRCKQLTKWFHEILTKKGTLKGTIHFQCDISCRAIILALAHCYHSRFADKLLRKLYREIIAKVFAMHGYGFCDRHEDFILGVIREEQKDILGRMELPPGTACNTALQENVFVILVCIFNRIPIFVVGKPGCSKSLAMQLIRSNLRGKDSKDEFFKSLPQLYCVSFQGSESSTSDGILKVFDKADKYQISNSREDVLSVVILDEIGLAEISRFNPLKVLHNLLEPDGKSQPNVAVVGISNWALDASKMNRAIHLSRTEMDIEELFDTAVSISESFLDSEASKSESLFEGSNMGDSVPANDITNELHGMAEAYFNYTKQMRFKNFHGLRDYYSLVKYVARVFAEKGSDLNEAEKANVIICGLERNFGGLPAEKQTLNDVFRRFTPLSSLSKHTVIDLVTQNVQDPIARHLMLITTGESVLGIIEQKMHEIGCERIEVIYGSQFEEDLTDDYNYRILSRIILCMEEGVILILKDLESIYGSLYDMLNQNYTTIGKKRNCRVALGPYSNPICHVADSFRCIVLIDETKIDMSDPPFLNRFEKQYLRFFDIINDPQKALISKIESWIDELTSLGSSKLSKHDIFPIYSEDMVASLVLRYDKRFKLAKDMSCEVIENETVFRECKKKLLWVIKPEIVIRIKSTNQVLGKSNSHDVVGDYFSLPVHGGLNELISYHMETQATGAGHLSVLFTNSNVHAKVHQLIEDLKVQVEKVGAFKSEKQLSSKIQFFWERDDCQILVVQCNAKEDERHIMLTKLVIERYRREYQRKDFTQQKHVYFIVHLDRSTGKSSCVTQLNFLSDWNLIMIDSIDCPKIKLPELCSMPLLDAIQEKRPFHDYLKDELFWAFTRIKYEDQSRNVTSLTDIITKMESSSEFLEILDKEVWSWIWKNKSGNKDKNWQLTVACDTTLLSTSSSFVNALETFVLGVIKMPLSKYIYSFELHGILDSFFSTEKRYTSSGSLIDNNEERQQAWVSLLQDTNVFSLNGIPDETGPECYTCPTHDLSLQMPFSLRIFEKVEETKDNFLEIVQLYKTQCLLEDDEELPNEVYEEVLCQQESFILQKLPDLNKFLYKMWGDDYLDDFCNVCSHKVCPSMHKRQRTEYAKLILAKHIKMDYEDPFNFVIRLHTTFWVQFPYFRAKMMLIEASLKVVPGMESAIKKTLSGSLYICTATSKISPDVLPEIQTGAVNTELTKDNGLSEGYSEYMVLQNKCADENIDLEKTTIEETVLSYDTLSSTSKTDEENGKCKDDFEEKEFAESDDEKSLQMVPEQLHNSGEIYMEELENIKQETVYSNPSKTSFRTEPHTDETDTDVHTLDMKHEMPLSDNECLVQLLCQKMIPTSDTISFHGGVLNWYRKVSSTLSLAYQVTQTTKLLYALKICTELSAELIIPFDLDDKKMEHIGNVLDQGFDLDSNEVFEQIKSVFDAALESGSDLDCTISTTCMKMLSSYLIMCIYCEPETSALNFMYSLILDGYIREEHIYLLKAPLCLSLSLVEREIIFSLIHSQSETDDDSEHDDSEHSDLSDVGDDCPLFENLNQVISSVCETKDIGHKFIVLIVDMFQNMFREYLRKDVENKESITEVDPKSSFSQAQAEEIFLACHMILRKEIVGIRYVAAVGYFKAYIDFIVSQWNLKEGVDSNIEILDAVLSDDTNADLHQNANIFFIKMMSRNSSLSRVESFCQTYSNEYKCFQQMQWTESYCKQCVEKALLCIYINKDMHEKVTICRNSSDISAYKDEIQNIVIEAKESVDGLLSMFSLAINEYYLCRVSAPLDDTKRTKASIFLNEVIGQGFENEVVSFLQCITGEENFYFDVFNLTEESSDTQFYKVSFLSSLYAVVLGNFAFTERKLMSIFMKCLCVPMNLKDCMFPGFHRSNNKGISSLSAPGMCAKIALCSCGNQVAFYDNREVFICPVCNSKFDDLKNSDDIVDETDLECLFSVKTDLDLLEFSQGMHPVALHVVQLLTKACLLGSKALNPSDPPNIEEITGVPDVNVCEELWSAIGSHWETLRRLLNVENSILFVFLQAILYESTDLICNANLSNTLKELLSWEKQFDHIIGAVLDKRFTHIQQIIKRHDGLHDFGEEVMERRIYEVDTEDSLSDARALYRTTVVPEKVSFVSELYVQRDEFRLLAFVLQNEEKLNLPEHIFNIINWHMATIANSNYILKKSECLKMSAQDFIYNKQERNKGHSVIVWDRFESFRKSWDYLIDNMSDKGIVSKMKRIHSESKMFDCLILNEKSVVFEVLKTLVDIQNSLVTEVLTVANSSIALQFLFRDMNVAVFPSVQIMDIKREQLLTNKINWQIILGQESQCDLRYGHGRLIHYYFESIEQSVAVDVFSGKAFIQMTKGFPKIIFKDELHKNYSSLIRELKLNIPQESLPSEIVNGIKSRKEEDPRMATQLLTHLGIVMSLLKKTRGDPDLPLVEYINKWKSLFADSFPKKLLPSPDTSTKLCHVIGLSELLEELCADSVKNGLNEEFRCKLDRPIMDQILKTLKEERLANAFLKALKRFTYRCLSSRTASSNQTLREYLSDDTFWPDGCLIDGYLIINEKHLKLTDVLPDGLMVRHTFACLTEMEKNIEKRRQEDIKLTTFATSFKTNRASPAVKATEKKRKAVKYRKF